MADKQSLLVALMREHMEALLAAQEALGLPADPEAALDSFVRFHIRYHADRPDEVFIAYMELRNLTPANFAEIEHLRRAYEDRLQAIIAQGAGQGIFRVRDPRVATMAVIAMLTGVTTWFRPDGRLSLDEVEAIYVEMVRRSVGGR